MLWGTLTLKISRYLMGFILSRAKKKELKSRKYWKFSLDQASSVKHHGSYILRQVQANGLPLPLPQMQPDLLIVI